MALSVHGGLVADSSLGPQVEGANHCHGLRTRPDCPPSYAQGCLRRNWVSEKAARVEGGAPCEYDSIRLCCARIGRGLVRQPQGVSCLALIGDFPSAARLSSY